MVRQLQPVVHLDTSQEVVEAQIASQVIQSGMTFFIPDRWRSPTTPEKGHVFTVPKRSRLESPGGGFCYRSTDQGRDIVGSKELAWEG